MHDVSNNNTGLAIIPRIPPKIPLTRRLIPNRDIVNPCGHSVNETAEPRNNCTVCWNAYFVGNPVTYNGASAALRAFGRNEVMKTRGEKFVKQLERLNRELTIANAVESV